MSTQFFFRKPFVACGVVYSNVYYHISSYNYKIVRFKYIIINDNIWRLIVIPFFVIGGTIFGKKENPKHQNFVLNAKALIGTDQEKEFLKN